MKADYKYYIEGERIYLREVRLSDVNENYYRWLNDQEVNQYLETRHTSQTLEAIKQYVEKMSREEDQIFLAICLKETDRHIGNIKLGSIDRFNHSADISLVIGEKDCWGKRIATEAIMLMVDYGFNKLKLHRVSAGVYVDNIASIKAFERTGFKEEGTKKECGFYNDRYRDAKLFGIINKP